MLTHKTPPAQGCFRYGETAVLTATPETEYKFVNWTEDGMEVSTNAIYSFTVSENRTLTANFDTKNNIIFIEKKSVRVFPNPTNRIINIECADNSIQKLIVSDITGKLLVLFVCKLSLFA